MADKLADYIPVHQRIEQFRKEHPSGRILTAIVPGETLIFRAEIYLTDSEVPNAVAHACEDGGMGLRGKSVIEKTETAAVGRALAFMGYEIKQGIASREEMQKVERPGPKPVMSAAEVEAEHTRMDESIRAELRRISKKDDDTFNKWVQEEFETTSDWPDLSLEYKSDLLGTLRKMKAKAS